MHVIYLAAATTIELRKNEDCVYCLQKVTEDFGSLKRVKFTATGNINTFEVLKPAKMCYSYS
jgi:hypothetical protein